jgi:uncharacterized protein with GYD domain
MATYVVLIKLTDQGIKDIKNAPQRIESVAKATEAMGGKMTSFYYTLGEYDYIGIYEGLTDEAIASLGLKIGSLGNVRTTALKAFTTKEFAEIVKKLP